MCGKEFDRREPLRRAGIGPIGIDEVADGLGDLGGGDGPAGGGFWLGSQLWSGMSAPLDGKLMRQMVEDDS